MHLLSANVLITCSPIVLGSKPKTIGLFKRIIWKIPASHEDVTIAMSKSGLGNVLYYLFYHHPILPHITYSRLLTLSTEIKHTTFYLKYSAFVYIAHLGWWILFMCIAFLHISRGWSLYRGSFITQLLNCLLPFWPFLLLYVHY